MADEPTPTTVETEAPSFDMDSAVDKIGSELFPGHEPAEAEPVEAAIQTEADDTVAAEQTAPTTRNVPKSWPKEMHDYWGKTDPKVQEYWETREKQMLDGLDQYKTDAQWAKQFKESLAPYRQTLQQFGVDEVTAAKHLFQADHNLRYSPPEQKLAYFRELAKSYGIDLGQALQQQTQPVDPTIQAIQSEMQHMKQALTAREQADYQAAREKVGKEVETFAADTKAHPYFDEVADDIIALLQTGASLQDAYDKAVWANPVTREKEVAARLQSEQAKAKENARLDALKAKTASSSNVRSRDTKRTPTEPMGTMEDTLKESLREIRTRTTH